jgi:DNA replication factor GINS
MDLEELRTVQTRERATDGLQELRDSFYEDVAAYLADLRETRREAAAEADDPFRSPRVNDLTDEIETAEQVAAAIYDRRVGKLLKQASLAASGMTDDPSGLTAEEHDLYEAIVSLIEENKSLVLESFSGEREIDSDLDLDADRQTESATTDPNASNSKSNTSNSESNIPRTETETPRTETETPRTPPPPDRPPKEAREGQSPTSPEPEEIPADDVDGDESLDSVPDGAESDADAGDSSIERLKVRITEDVGEILGVDERAYTLSAEDVVDLPEANATPLIERDAAERLE